MFTPARMRPEMRAALNWFPLLHWDSVRQELSHSNFNQTTKWIGWCLSADDGCIGNPIAAPNTYFKGTATWSKFNSNSRYLTRLSEHWTGIVGAASDTALCQPNWTLPALRKHHHCPQAMVSAFFLSEFNEEQQNPQRLCHEIIIHFFINQSSGCLQYLTLWQFQTFLALSLYMNFTGGNPVNYRC
jgi:hypothetical protein